MEITDDEISYMIDKESYYIEYKDNILHIPFIMDTMKSTNAISEIHNEIKECLFNLDKLIDELPELVLCELPTYKDFSGDMYILNEFYSLYYGTNIGFYPLDTCYSLSIYYDGIKNNITLATYNDCDIFSINNKIIVTNQPFDPELFTNAIKKYVDNHLMYLLKLFKVNKIKSAKSSASTLHD